ncbi:TPA: hypothetical protein P6246_003040 [Escherichia coli]|nr:hypothetical protein [Escherichia coli]
MLHLDCKFSVIRRRLRMELKESVINYSPFVLQHP